MIKRPMFALLTAVLLGILLNDLGIAAAVAVECVWALIVIVFFFLSERFKNIFLKIFTPEWYGNLIILLGLLPLVFALSFVLTGYREGVAASQRETYSVLYEKGETHVIAEGEVVKVQKDKGYLVLKLDRCIIKGYNEFKEREAGGCFIYIPEDKNEDPKCGNRVVVYGRYYFIEEPQNPGEYDLLPKCLKENVHARIFAKKVRITDDRSGIGGYIRQFLCYIAMKFEEGIMNVFNEEDGGLLIAMITGNRNFEDEETVTLYRRTGIGHILAISGLHVSLLCMGLWTLLRRYFCGKYTAAVATLAFLGFFLCFTGGSVSAVRAGIMCVVLITGKLVRKHYDLLSSLAAAACVILLIWPGELKDPAFILSFTAIAAVHFSSKFDDKVLFGFFVTTFTMPVTACIFYEIPTYSFISNLIVIPLTGILLGLGILSGLFGITVPAVGKIFGGGAFMILRVFEGISEFTSNLPFSCVLTGRPGILTVVGIYACIFAVYRWMVKQMEYKKDKRLAARLKRPVYEKPPRAEGIVIAVVVLVLVLCFNPKENSLTFLSVGQGDCSVFRSEDGDSVVFDSGSTSETGVGEKVLGKYMKSEGIMLLDLATVSHTDEDHISGIMEILENMKVYRNEFDYRMRYDGNVGIKCLVLPEVREKGEAYERLEELAARKNVKLVFVRAGEELSLKNEACRLLCLAPVEARSSENETSLVFLLDTPKFIAYMMGDAGKEEEKEVMRMLDRLGVRSVGSKQVILKVGHHGSYSATSPDFLDLICPDLAVISCGRGNPYGHPHRSVLELLKERGIEVHRTDRAGAKVVAEE